LSPLDPVAAAAPGLRDLRRLAWAAAAVALVVRLPWAAQRLWDHDSVQFALGVERYDLAAHHPHPPGYPLWIAFLKLLAAVGVDPLHGMVALAILGGALGAGCMVLVVGRLISSPLGGGGLEQGGGQEGGATTGLTLPAAFAAALYIFNPLLWFYGELPLIYAVEGGVTVLLAWAALRMEEGRAPFLIACALFALAGGLRQSTLVLLAPLFLYGLWRTWKRARLTPGLFAAGAALGGALVLAWLVPLCMAAGGYAAYRRISGEHFKVLLPQTSILYGAGWGALAHNLEVLTKWALQGIVAGTITLLLLWLVTPARIVPGLRLLIPRLPFLLTWATPPMLFFALFHITKAGYTLVHLPALLAALAVAATPALAVTRWRAIGATAFAAALGASLFLWGADRRPDQPRLWAVVRHEFNRNAIAEYETALDRVLATVRRYPPGETILASIELSGTGPSGADGFLYSWHRHLQWYLPEYPVYFLVPEEGFAEVTEGHHPFVRETSPIEVPAGTKRIVFVLSALPGARLPLGPGIAERIGKELWLVTIPFREGMRVGPLVLEPLERQKSPSFTGKSRRLR
jgi:4-amino-4-deoxy-L-arabinose transferase-like glycosyltransferase